MRLARVGIQLVTHYAGRAMDHDWLRRLVHEVLPRMAGERAGLVSLETKPLRGGTSADQVVSIAVGYLDGTGRRGVLRLVAKELSGPARREAAVYRHLARHRLPFTPRVLALEQVPGGAVLLLEQVRSLSRWPWWDTAHCEAVLRVAADLHAAGVACAVPWDYDGELDWSAGETLRAVSDARRACSAPVDAASVRAVRRVVGALCAIRREIVFRGPFARTLIHGDLHPGNVVVPGRAGAARPILLDWGRARAGSPLEDVASWVQSLGCWEPEARLRHDSLLAAYLRARGCDTPIASRVRQVYWLAGASNALAGALRHHLGVAASRPAPAARYRALLAVRDWLRIIRRAEAVWLEPERSSGGARDRRTRRPPAGCVPTPAS